MIKVSNFRIDDFGDLSVGIFPSHWNIEGELYFEDEEEFGLFQDKINEAWELICAWGVTFNYEKSEA